MALNLPTLNGGGSPISADLMYRFYDNKAITPQIRDAVQKKQDAADAAAKEDEEKNPSSKPAEKDSAANKPGPAAKVSISEQVIRMSMASKTAKPEDLKSRVEPSEEVKAIEKKLAEQKAAEDGSAVNE